MYIQILTNCSLWVFLFLLFHLSSTTITLYVSALLGVSETSTNMFTYIQYFSPSHTHKLTHAALNQTNSVCLILSTDIDFHKGWKDEREFFVLSRQCEPKMRDKWEEEQPVGYSSHRKAPVNVNGKCWFSCHVCIHAVVELSIYSSTVLQYTF